MHLLYMCKQLKQGYLQNMDFDTYTKSMKTWIWYHVQYYKSMFYQIHIPLRKNVLVFSSLIWLLSRVLQTTKNTGCLKSTNNRNIQTNYTHNCVKVTQLPKPYPHRNICHKRYHEQYISHYNPFPIPCITF